MDFEELREFGKDKKKLTKKYRSISEDLETVKQVLEIFPDQRPPFSFIISNLGIETCVIKVKKIACKALKGKGVNSGLRLVYAYFENDLEQVSIADDSSGQDPHVSVAREKIVFIELYHKGEKESEDRDRILRHFE